MRYVHDPVILERNDQPYAGVACRISTDVKESSALAAEILEWLRCHKELPAGPPFIRYWYLIEDEKWQIEVGIPTKRLLEGDLPIVTGYLPGGAYAHAIHYGPPDEFGKSSKWLIEWIEKEGLSADLRYEGETKIWNGRFGFFITDPFEEKIQDAWKIGVYILLHGDSAA